MYRSICASWRASGQGSYQQLVGSCQMYTLEFYYAYHCCPKMEPCEPQVMAEKLEVAVKIETG